MEQLKLINRINELFSIFVAQIKGATSLHLYDINSVSEDVLVPVFKEIYGYENLRNVNIDKSNYPGIDLADEDNRVAFQITSTSNSKKIQHSLTQFFKHNLHEKYDQLYIYILSEKQKSYSGKWFEEAIEPGFQFNKNKDIIDYRDLLKQIKSLPLEKIKQVKSILESQFGKAQTEKFLVASPPPQEDQRNDLKLKQTEEIYTNLLEIFFPDTLFVADLNIDRKEIIQASKEFGKRLKRNAPSRQVVYAAIKQRGLSFSGDWVCHENKIITFHDLYDNELPLAKIIDKGTITDLESSEFYEADQNYERVFKELLYHCLSKKLYDKKVDWKYEHRLFVFLPENGLTPRRIRWHSKVQATRTVFDVKMKKTKPEEVSYYKHLAFQVNFKLFNNKWYVEITPEWFISYKGFKKSLYGYEQIKYLKSKEKNEQVFNHLKFIAYFLKYDEPSDWFTKRYIYPFLNFGELLSLNGHPFIDDKDWSRNESKEELKRMKDPQKSLPLKY